MRRRNTGADEPADDADTPTNLHGKVRRRKRDDAMASKVKDSTTAAVDEGAETALPPRKRKGLSTRKAVSASKEQDSTAGEDQQIHDHKKRAAGRGVSAGSAGIPVVQPGPVKKQRRAARLQEEATAPGAGGAQAVLATLPPETAEAALALETAAQRGVPQGDSGDDDDDDAPEEVTLAVGRSEAAAQRAAEREVRAQQRAAAKEKGRRRAAMAEAQREARMLPEEQTPVGSAADAEGVGMEAGSQQLVDQEDLLPQDVIAALTRRARDQVAGEPGGQEPMTREATNGRQQQAAKAKLRKSGSQQVGPAFVQVLSDIPGPRASEAALAFRRGRLHGPGVRRSGEMLVPATSKYFGPAAAFA